MQRSSRQVLPERRGVLIDKRNLSADVRADSRKAERLTPSLPLPEFMNVRNFGIEMARQNVYPEVLTGLEKTSQDSFALILQSSRKHGVLLRAGYNTLGPNFLETLLGGCQKWILNTRVRPCSFRRTALARSSPPGGSRYSTTSG